MTTCDNCQADYDKAKKSQRFCSTKCRQAYHNSYKRLAGPIGTLTIVRKIKTGATSVTVHFDEANVTRSLDFEVGDTVVVASVSVNELHAAGPGVRHESRPYDHE